MRPLLPLLALCAALLLAAGCLPRETRVEAGNRQQILHRGVGYEVNELDPHVVTGVAEGNILRALFEGLVTEDPVDLRPVPGVAERWEISADGLTYTFRLRGDARWSDGRPVTARDFTASFQRILTPSLAADYANMLYILRGAEAFHKGGGRDFASVGAEAVDDRTLRLTLEHPAAYFLSLLTNPPWYPVPVETIARHGPVAQRGNPWTRPAHIVTNGPFRLTEWRQNQVIAVEKFPGYWDAATVRLNGIRFYPLDSVDAEERAFRAGQLHVTEYAPISKIDAYRQHSPHLLRLDPYLATYFFRLNTRRPPLNDVRVRRALALAIDREAINQVVFNGEFVPGNQWVNPTNSYYQQAFPVPKRDVAKAKALLKEAGVTGPITLDFMVPNGPETRAVAEVVQSMAAEAGFDLKIRVTEFATSLKQGEDGDFQLYLIGWSGRADPDGNSFIFQTCNAPQNNGKYCDKEVDAAHAEARSKSDPAVRKKAYETVARKFLADGQIIYLYHPQVLVALSDKVDGYRQMPDGLLRVVGVKLK